MIRDITCFTFLSLMIICCNRNTQTLNAHLVFNRQTAVNYNTIGEITVPAGYERMPVGKDSFGEWLKEIKLKKDSRVYLYDGRLKDNQSAQFAVLDMPVGDKDLQQCADAVLRLRAEYFFGRGNMGAIHFKGTGGTVLSFERWLKGERYKLSGNRLLPYMSGITGGNKRTRLEQFLEVVFTYCGTLSLDRETKPVYDLNDMQAGDMLVKGGSPGHAMTIVDVAINRQGEKVFMLAQGYMPAQDIHIVKNPTDENFSPWYRVTADSKIITPGWIFNRNQLKRW
jgi:hypothetical protein